jgi:hypothetical protein
MIPRSTDKRLDLWEANKKLNVPTDVKCASNKFPPLVDFLIAWFAGTYLLAVHSRGFAAFLGWSV